MPAGTRLGSMRIFALSPGKLVQRLRNEAIFLCALMGASPLL
jgi:hypothetical protein